MGFIDDVADVLFGDEGDTDVRRLTTGTTEQSEGLQLLLSLLTGAASSGAIDKSEDELISEILGIREQIPTDQLIGGIPEIQSAISGLLQGGPVFDIDQTFKDLVQDPLLRDFQETVIPELRRSFAPEFFGGERLQAEEKATEDLLQTLVQARAGLAQQFTQQQSQNILGGLQTSGAGASLANLIAGSQQEFLESAATRGDRRLDILRLLLGASTAPTTENVVTQTSGGGGLIGDLIGGGAKLGVAALGG